MTELLSSVVLAAGKGTRMHSAIPKVMHKIAGKTLLEHVLLNLKEAGIQETAVILGYQKELIEKSLPDDVKWFEQKQQLGTAHALMQAKPFLENKKGYVLVCCADAPLQDEEVLTSFIEYARTTKSDLCVLSAELSDPRSYGRIIKENNELVKIVEKKDASEEELSIKEVNSGTYLFSIEKLLSIFDEFSAENSQREYYLTDSIMLFRQKGYRTTSYKSMNANVISAANDRYELSVCEKLMRDKINRELMLKGVSIPDPDNTYIDRGVQIGEDSVISPGCFITGNTCIGKNNIIVSSHIDNSIIGNCNKIESSTIESSTVENNTKIGPYAHLRPNSMILDDAKIGNFVEIKNSTIGKGSKASHLTYVGDSDVGRNVNLGCGVVFVNYDGKNKFRSVIEDDAFIGCNVNIIAPVRIGKHALIAAGSTVTSDVEQNALLIARSREVHKPDYNKEEEQ